MSDVQSTNRPRWFRITAWSTGALAIIAILALVVGYFAYRHYDGRIDKVDVLQPHDPKITQPDKQEHAENYLLIGSDTRAGRNSGYGNVDGARSDTTIIAHLSADGKHATLVSIPRDAWVDIPRCKQTDGTWSQPTTDMFNSAFATGGPTCTILTVQALTGIKITHYAQVDFVGFKNMVNALGGVDVYSPEDVNDSDSGLRLHKGKQEISGDQALAYVRARYALGDGSDLDRIERQQRFMAAMIGEAGDRKILTNPGRLKSFMDAATGSVTVDKDTSLRDLYGLAKRLRGLDPNRVSFYTAPIANRDYTPPGQIDGGRVKLDDRAGAKLWSSIIEDTTPPTAYETHIRAD